MAAYRVYWIYKGKRSPNGCVCGFTTKCACEIKTRPVRQG